MSGFTVRGCKALTDDITTVFTVSVKSAVDKYLFCFSNMHLFSVTRRKTRPSAASALVCLTFSNDIGFFCFFFLWFCPQRSLRPALTFLIAVSI